MVDHFGAVDILVTTPGSSSWKPFLEQDFGEIDEQVNVNLLGVMKLTWCFLPLVTDAVITVGSTATLHESRTPPPVLCRPNGACAASSRRWRSSTRTSGS